eukprot:609433-Amorphochlora_amoeboformis.AAC.2
MEASSKIVKKKRSKSKSGPYLSPLDADINIHRLLEVSKGNYTYTGSKSRLYPMCNMFATAAVSKSAGSKQYRVHS